MSTNWAHRAWMLLGDVYSKTPETATKAFCEINQLLSAESERLAAGGYRVNTTKTAIVALNQFWIPLTEQQPTIGPRLLLIHKPAGVARIDRFAPKAWATHWCGLPKFKE